MVNSCNLQMNGTNGFLNEIGIMKNIGTSILTLMKLNMTISIKSYQIFFTIKKVVFIISIVTNTILTFFTRNMFYVFTVTATVLHNFVFMTFVLNDSKLIL